MSCNSNNTLAHSSYLWDIIGIIIDNNNKLWMKLLFVWIERHIAIVGSACQSDEQPITMYMYDNDINQRLWMKMLFVWIDKHKAIFGSALHLDEQPVIM